MKLIETPYWKDKKERAVTFSYDDGRIEDIKLVELFNKYGLKASFHLCDPAYMKKLTGAEFVPPEAYAALYSGHEISCHTAYHPFPTYMPDEAVRAQISENRKYLEALCGYPVRGMSYPYGNFDERVIGICRAAGMEYARTVSETGAFGIPADFMRWDATCHHSRADKALAERFFSPMRFDKMRLMYVWGHSYEFCNEELWSKMEDFCREITCRDDVWYATNIEIADYARALRSLRFSEECTSVYNPTCQDLWISVDGEAVLVEAGKVVKL